MLTLVSFGLALVDANYFSRFIRQALSADYTTVNGVILNSSVKSFMMDNAMRGYGKITNTTVQIQYRYNVGDYWLESSCVRYLGDNSPESTVLFFQSGKEVVVYLNPKDNYDSLLMPGLSVSDWITACGLLFANGLVLVGFIIMRSRLRRV